MNLNSKWSKSFDSLAEKKGLLYPTRLSSPGRLLGGTSGMHLGICFLFGERDLSLPKKKQLQRKKWIFRRKIWKPQKAKCNFAKCVFQK